MNWYSRSIDFLKEVRAELKRTTWPAWKEVQGTTTVVIVTVFIFAVFLFIVDLALQSVVEQIVGFFSR